IKQTNDIELYATPSASWNEDILKWLKAMFSSRNVRDVEAYAKTIDVSVMRFKFTTPSQSTIGTWVRSKWSKLSAITIKTGHMSEALPCREPQEEVDTSVSTLSRTDIEEDERSSCQIAGDRSAYRQTVEFGCLNPGSNALYDIMAPD
ncbi:hypothetical protein PHMEG_00021937, partial [Phytophthora megakarya]